MDKKYRYEQKYFININDSKLLKNYLSSVMQIDKYSCSSSGYFIRSLYFDDDDLTSYNEKECGVYKRSKYRIRMYNYDKLNIILEKKTKEGDFVYKESQKISIMDFKNIINKDYHNINFESDSLIEKFIIKARLDNLLPKVIVDYNRIAYTLNDIRVTIDYDIMMAEFDDNFFDSNLKKINILDDSLVLLEIKYNDILPSYLKEIFVQFPLIYTSFSKYNLSMDKKEEQYGELE